MNRQTTTTTTTANTTTRTEYAAAAFSRGYAFDRAPHLCGVEEYAERGGIWQTSTERGTYAELSANAHIVIGTSTRRTRRAMYTAPEHFTRAAYGEYCILAALDGAIHALEHTAARTSAAVDNATAAADENGAAESAADYAAIAAAARAAKRWTSEANELNAAMNAITRGANAAESIAAAAVVFGGESAEWYGRAATAAAEFFNSTAARGVRAEFDKRAAANIAPSCIYLVTARRAQNERARAVRSFVDYERAERAAHILRVLAAAAARRRVYAEPSKDAAADFIAAENAAERAAARIRRASLRGYLAAAAARGVEEEAEHAAAVARYENADNTAADIFARRENAAAADKRAAAIFALAANERERAALAIIASGTSGTVNRRRADGGVFASANIAECARMIAERYGITAESARKMVNRLLARLRAELTI